MDNWVDMARVASRQDHPISLNEAIQCGVEGKTLIRVLPTTELAEVWFDGVVSMLVAQGLVTRMKHLRASLKGGGYLAAVTEHQAEGDALRGINMVWIS